MNKDAAQSSRPPFKLKGLQESRCLSAALMRLDAQLRNFTPLRDRLLATGQDANATSRQIRSQRPRHGRTEETHTGSGSCPNRLPYPPHPGPVLSGPIASAKLFPGNSLWFGFAGIVQMGRASEGDDIVPPGTTGSLYGWSLSDKGAIWFGGQLQAGPVAGQPAEHFWIHSWVYLIPFPAPAVNSIFTYSFLVPVEVAAVSASGGVTFWSFVSVGETPDFTGQEVVVNQVVSFPLVADLNGRAPRSRGSVEHPTLVFRGGRPCSHGRGGARCGGRSGKWRGALPPR